MKLKFKSWYFVALLFLIVEFIICPTGDFPLNDDWAYAKSIEVYNRTKVFYFSNWIAIPFISQFLIGLSFSKFFGFTFFGLRVITILISFINLLTFYKILDSFHLKENLKLIALLVFAFNPLTISLGNTFLPDIYILFFTLISFHFMLKMINNGGGFNYVLFIIFTLFGTLNRQTGILIPFIFLILYYVLSKKNKKNLLISILPFSLNIIALISLEFILKSHGILPDNYNLQLSRIIDSITHPTFSTIQQIGINFITSCICLGIFILPLTILNFKNHLKQIHQFSLVKWGFYLFLLIIICKVLLTGLINPFIGNMFYSFGTGPVLMTGFNTDKLQTYSIIGKFILILLNISGAISFYFAFFSIVKSINLKTVSKDNWLNLFFVLLFFIYLIPLCFNYTNDRYLLLLLPFFIVSYFKYCETEFNLYLFISLFSPIFFFSVASNYDYFRINDAKWSALNELTNKKLVLPQNIDGGFEFNGWYLSESINYDPSHEGRWWWIANEEYILSPKKRKGFKIETRIPFKNIISYPFDELYVLKREN